MVINNRILIVSFCIIAAVVSLLECNSINDFRIFSAASIDFFNGEPIYSKTYFDGYHFFYGPCFSILIYPFTLFPPKIGLFLWLLVQFFFLFRIFFLLKIFFLKAFGNSHTELKFYIIFLLCSIRFIRDNIHYAQLTIYILWSVLESFDSFNKQKNIRGSVILALGIHVKILPIVIMPWLIYRANFRAFFLTLAFIIAFFLFPVIFFGVTQEIALLKSWFTLINPAEKKHILDIEERSFHGLTTLIPVFFMQNVNEPYALPISRNILSLTYEQMIVLLNTTRILFILSFLFILNNKPFKNESNFLKQLFELLYLCALIPLIFPHQQAYAFLLSAPLLSLIVARTLVNTKSFSAAKIIMLCLLAVVILAFNIDLLLGQFHYYYFHFKIITWSLMLLLVLAIFLFIRWNKSDWKLK